MTLITHLINPTKGCHIPGGTVFLQSRGFINHGDLQLATAAASRCHVVQRLLWSLF